MENVSVFSSIWIRAGSLFVLIVLFQVFIAQAPSSSRSTSSSSSSSNSEVQRRFQHALTGHAMVQLSYMLPRTVCIVLLFVAATGMYVLRFYFYEVFLQAFGPLLRPSEKQDGVLPGAFYFLLGTGLSVWIFSSDSNDDSGVDMTIPRYAVECLALADPMASWIGSSVRSPKLSRSSSLAGCLACFGTAWVVGWLMLDQDFMTITWGALACTIAEGLLPWGNDNLTIPLLAAFAVDVAGHGSQSVLGKTFLS